MKQVFTLLIAILLISVPNAYSSWTGTVRIEAPSQTLFLGPLSISSCTITDDSAQAHPYSNSALICTLAAAASAAMLTYTITYTSTIPVILNIGSWSTGMGLSWNVKVNNYNTAIPLDQFILGQTATIPLPHNSVVWYYGHESDAVTAISASATSINQNDPITFTVTYFNDTLYSWLPLQSATVYASGMYLTDANGQVSISSMLPGINQVYAEKVNFIRSNRINVTVASVSSTSTTSSSTTSTTTTTSTTGSSSSSSSTSALSTTPSSSTSTTTTTPPSTASTVTSTVVTQVTTQSSGNYWFGVNMNDPLNQQLIVGVVIIVILLAGVLVYAVWHGGRKKLAEQPAAPVQYELEE